jgi:hypothetical protein
VTIVFLSVGAYLSANGSMDPAPRSKYIHHEVVPSQYYRNIVIITGRNNDDSGTFRDDYDSVHCDPTKKKT